MEREKPPTITEFSNMLYRDLRHKYEWLTANDQSKLPMHCTFDEILDIMLGHTRNKKIISAAINQLIHNKVLTVVEGRYLFNAAEENLTAAERLDREEARDKQAGSEIVSILGRFGIEFNFYSADLWSGENSSFRPKSTDDIVALADLLKTRLK